MIRFEEMELNSKILRAIGDMGFEEPSPIQAQAIPIQREGLDMIGQANRAGVPVGALAVDPAFARTLLDRGLDFLAYGIDTILMYQKCREVLERVLGQ